MEITLLGTGDSAGVPQIGCKCETCKTYSKKGKQRTRFSILIETERDKILIDTSPDLRFQFLRENISNVDAVIFTHAHYDHYAGLGDFYRILKELPIYGASEVLNPIQNRYNFLSFINPIKIESFNKFKISNLSFEIVPVHHPPINSYGIIIYEGKRKAVITSDTSRQFSDSSLERMKSPDLLIADALLPSDGEYPQYIEDRISKDGLSFGDKHMTYEGALDLSEYLGAKKTKLVHLSHYFSEEYSKLGEDGEILKI